MVFVSNLLALLAALIVLLTPFVHHWSRSRRRALARRKRLSRRRTRR